MSTDDWLAGTRTSYDTTAASYADVVRDILGGRQPYLNTALGLFAEQVLAAGGGPVADWLRDAGFTVESQWQFNMATDRPGAVLFARR